MGSKTGGNTEPMPFVRKWGAAATDTNGAADNGSVDPLASEGIIFLFLFLHAL